MKEFVILLKHGLSPPKISVFNKFLDDVAINHHYSTCSKTKPVIKCQTVINPKITIKEKPSIKPKIVTKPKSVSKPKSVMKQRCITKPKSAVKPNIIIRARHTPRPQPIRTPPAPPTPVPIIIKVEEVKQLSKSDSEEDLTEFIDDLTG